MGEVGVFIEQYGVFMLCGDKCLFYETWWLSVGESVYE